LYCFRLATFYTLDFISKGSTGLDFYFQIAKNKSETVLKSFSTINKSSLVTFLLAEIDIKPVR